MNVIQRLYALVRIAAVVSFSITGPFIISFGTFAGLLQFIETFFGSEAVSVDFRPKIYCTYLAFLWIGAIYVEYSAHDRKVPRPENSSSDPSDGIVVVSNDPRASYGIFRSFITGGISRLIAWILERDGITLYDVFRKPTYWDTYSEQHREYPIMRMNKGERRVEIRFPKQGPGRLLVRETLPGSDAFGEFAEEPLRNWWSLFLLAPIAFLRQFFA